MKVLVTRPVENARTTIKRLEQMGHSAIHEPLLSVERLATDLPRDPFDGIILTSSNAVKPLDEFWTLPRGDVPVFTTGTATADAARKIGFERLHSVDGPALDLVRELPGLTSRDWKLLYPCAETVAHDLPALLSEMEINCTAWPCYRTVPTKRISKATKTALENGDIDVVLLYSTRTAACFKQLVKDGDFPVPQLLALSAEICKSMPERLRQSCRHPNSPNEQELLKLL